MASGSYFRKKKFLFIVFVSLLVTGHTCTDMHTYMYAHIDNVGSLGNITGLQPFRGRASNSQGITAPI